ncbi:MAG: 16S rRNA (guanine(527)-N(7))-methyltransferase RsmG [Clostridia bacterium]|nr:16S rRNA (guanine(527)-N(7))-methyltransferase RsmG [Clostridia bacterium]
MSVYREILKSECEKMGISLAEDAFARFEAYAAYLIEYNQKVNLTAITEPAEIAHKHFVDCLLFFKAVQVPQTASLIDVGTGAGFPGVVLKIARPDIQLTLLDSLNKRLVFLQSLLEKLGLTAEIVHSRAEDGAKPPLREHFDFATARAVAALPVLCEYCLPYVKSGGSFVALKGAMANQEVAAAGRAVQILGGEKAQLVCLQTEALGSRGIVTVRKVHHTPPAYPRTAAKISKQPL